MHPLSNRRDICSYFVNWPLYVRRPYMHGMFGNLLYQHKKASTLLIKNILSMVLHSLGVFQCIHFQTGRIFPRTSVNQFAPICKAPLYARMFGNLLYQHKKAFTLLVKNIFSMVLYSLCVFQCIHFSTGGIFPLLKSG